MPRKHIYLVLVLFACFSKTPHLSAQAPTPINFGQSIVDNLPFTSSTVSYTTPFAQPGDVFMVRAVPTGLISLKIELFAPSGDSLTEYLANADRVVQFFYAIPPAPVGESGNYKMIVSGTDGFFTGEFCIFLQRVNETPNALALNCNSSLSRSLDCRSSVMSLRYMVQQGAISRIKIDANILSTPEAWLCASDGTILKHGISTGGNTLTFDTISAANTGCYFVFVTDHEAYFTTGGFNVSHTLLSGECAAPSVQLTPANGAVCAGSPFSLAADSPLPNASYAWSGPNGFTSMQAQISFPTAVDSLAGIYTVTITAPGVCPCVLAYEITIMALPTAMASVSPASGSICEKESFFLDVMTDASGGIGYHWSGPANFSSTQKSPYLFNTMPNQSGYYYISVTNSDGCTGTDSVHVAVHAPPEVTISQPVGDGVCKGSTLQLFVQTNVTPASFLWKGPNAFASTLQNPQILNITSANSGTYSVTVTDSYGCSSYELKYIAAWNPPTANISPLTSAICAGDSVKLVANGGISYKWSSGPVTKEINTKPSQTTIYSVTVTDNNGCTGTENATVTVNALPSISVTSMPSSTEICSGSGQILLSVTSSNANNPIWRWTKDGSFFSNNQFIVLSDTSHSGTFTASVTDGTTGCTNTALPVLVNIYQIPTVTISQTPLPYYVGDNITLCANSNATMPGYEWTGPNSFTTTSACALVNNASLLDAGFYYVTVTDIHGCQGAANINIDIKTVSTVEPAKKWGLSISPNPGSGLFQITAIDTSATHLQFVLFDGNGMRLRDFTLETASQTLDLTEMPAGLYILRVSDGQNTGALQLVKLKS